MPPYRARFDDERLHTRSPWHLLALAVVVVLLLAWLAVASFVDCRSSHAWWNCL